MGLNIGIEVKRYNFSSGRFITSYNSLDLEQEFFQHLRNRFPEAINGFGKGWASGLTKLDTMNAKDHCVEYDFGVRVHNHGSVLLEAGYTINEMYTAIAEFIFNTFGVGEDEMLEMKPYWSQ